jgi:hypothetical protein
MHFDYPSYALMPDVVTHGFLELVLATSLRGSRHRSGQIVGSVEWL